MKPTIVPFVKWVGGKRQIMDELKEIFAIHDFNNYHEPFVGGGAVFIEMLNNNKQVSSINDLNGELINAYEVVRDNPNELILGLKKLQDAHSRFQYYDLRKIDRKANEFAKLGKIDRACRFIYLNKTSFNGIYRVNKNNHFNVPMGYPWNLNLKLVDEKNIFTLSSKMKESKLKIFNDSYKYILNLAKEGDLVYFDPPYDAFEDEINFVGYQKDGFTQRDQEELRDVCDELLNRGVFVVVSNHDTKNIQKLYSPERYYIRRVVSVNRNINSDPTKRGKKEIEVIIYGKKK